MGMEAQTKDKPEPVIGETDRQPPPEEPRSRPDAPPPGVPGAPRAKPRGEGAEEEERGGLAVEAYARDHEGLTEENEQDALDFLLAPKPARVYGVTVQYDTEAGLLPLTFVVRGTNGRKIDEIEQSYVSETTGRMDGLGASCALVAEATLYIEGLVGNKVELSDEKFLTLNRPNPEDPDGPPLVTRLASPVEALEARFATQFGLLSGVAGEIRRISGYDPEKVGSARRRLVNAAGNS